jgi:N-acetylmuramoyl-L-alanine amidase
MLAQAKALVATLPRWVAAAAAMAVPALVVLTFVGLSAGQGRATSEGVLRVRMGGDQAATRVVIELEHATRGQVVSDDDNPTEVVLALSGVDVPGDLHGRGAGLVRDWSVDEAAGAARIKLTLNRQATVRRRFLLPPSDGVKVYRYVVDLEATPGGAIKTVATVQAPAASRDLAERADFAPTPPPRRGKRLIVIDAGHGGHDPGASGASTHEKTVTLAAARELKSRLERTGRYRVVMTRSQDTYIPLGTRVAIARRAGADLFISLHADVGADRTVRGASVYTLSEHGVDRAARKVIGRNDWLQDASYNGRDTAVKRILLDLTQRDTSNRSSAFSRLLLDRLETRTPLLRRSHRDAGFAVLLAPDVPAVLLEMGFITNPDDEAELTDPVRRGRLMDGVAEAVDDYFGQGGGYATVAALP